MRRIGIVLALLLAGCGSTSSVAPPSTTTTQPPNVASFKGVSFTAPQGWTVVQQQSDVACIPYTSSVIYVGDFKSYGDCPPPNPDTAWIFLRSEFTGYTTPSTTIPLGRLRGWIEPSRGVGFDSSTIVLPDQNVEVAFYGPATSLVDEVKASLRPT